MNRSALLPRILPILLVGAHLLLNRNVVMLIDESPGPVPRSGAVTIVQVSDLHFGNHITRSHRRAARAINRLEPDILLITGDSAGLPGARETLVEWLSGLEAAEGRRFASLGNWEYEFPEPAETIGESYTAGGVRLLVNEAVDIEVKGRSFRIVGTDDWFGGIIPTGLCVGSTGSVTELVMAHEPVIADVLAGQMDGSVIFSGHTHGGQIRILGRAVYRPPGSGVYLEGSYEVGGNTLIVSRGVGTSTLALRLGAEPDLRIYRLPASSPAGE